jgi:hypothetical protein
LPSPYAPVSIRTVYDSSDLAELADCVETIGPRSWDAATMFPRISALTAPERDRLLGMLADQESLAAEIAGAGHPEGHHPPAIAFKDYFIST